MINATVYKFTVFSLIPSHISLLGLFYIISNISYYFTFFRLTVSSIFSIYLFVSHFKFFFVFFIIFPHHLSHSLYLFSFSLSFASHFLQFHHIYASLIRSHIRAFSMCVCVSYEYKIKSRM